MKQIATVFLLVLRSISYGQTDNTGVAAKQDTGKAHILGEIVVRAYGQDMMLMRLPAAVNIIDEKDLARYNNTSILSAINATPGVRMEERSPGSYRFGIRGSALESPFGVRNIKVYYNDIPFTDPGGNTYLNQLGFYNIRTVEIIKGPAGSLYGAGTGGALLINSMPQQWQPGVSLNYTGGSYGLSNAAAEVRFGDSSKQNIIRYQYLASDGYRRQSAVNKQVASWDAVLKSTNNTRISTHFLYGDLAYQTPGGLTLAEYALDPRMARPQAGTSPGAEQSHAEIYQKTFLAGFTLTEQLSGHWQNSTTLYADYSQMLNPNIRNYSRTSEPNFGGRSAFKYQDSLGQSVLQWITGAEVQDQPADDRTFKNIDGTPGSLQTDQEINTRLMFVFTQLSWQFRQWVVTAGASLDQLQLSLRTLYPTPYNEQNKTFSNQVAPRIAVLNRIGNNTSVYATVEKGFSPPTVSELVPTGGSVNLALQPEQGWNYEAGVRGNAMHQRIYFDASLFYFSLRNAIVERRDSAGGDHYLNAGSTTQPGFEAYIAYRVLNDDARPLHCDAWLSYTGHYFHYDKFVQLDNDYSGKDMPGIAPNTIAAGIDVYANNGLYTDLTYFFSDKIPLDDANTASAASYHLLGIKAGYKKQLKKYTFNVFAGIDNVLDQNYSLGNDINAAGSRYYNAAPGINYYAGVSIDLLHYRTLTF